MHHTRAFPTGSRVAPVRRNIKHAFFQPAKGEMITLLHFHLINPIMVNKKKTTDVQVYTEVMDTVQTIDSGRRSMYDPDEIEEENREREQRRRVRGSCAICAFVRAFVAGGSVLACSCMPGAWVHRFFGRCMCVWAGVRMAEG